MAHSADAIEDDEVDRPIAAVAPTGGMMGSLVLYSTTPVPAPTQIVEHLREAGVIDDTLRLVVLQTPLDEPEQGQVDILRDQFSVGGIQVEAVDPVVQDRADAFRPDAVAEMRKAQVILGTGGSPERMVQVLRDSPVLDAMREVWARGGWVGGGSAGAMAFGVGMPGMAGEPIRFLDWVPFVIAPHFGNYPIEPWKAAFPDHPILGLPDGAVAIIDGTTILSAGTAALEIHDHLTDAVTSLAPGEQTTWNRRLDFIR